MADAAAQYFKGDEVERKVYACVAPIMAEILIQRGLLVSECYQAGDLGDVIYDNNWAPLANAIDKQIFRSTFADLFGSFISAGTAEAYIAVFQKIFGDDVEITFTVPAPGQLGIEIVASGTELSHMLGRHISDNIYLFDDVVTTDGDNISFATIKGFQSQYELEQMLFEMVPEGISTDITLTVGS